MVATLGTRRFKGYPEQLQRFRAGMSRVTRFLTPSKNPTFA